MTTNLATTNPLYSAFMQQVDAKLQANNGELLTQMAGMLKPLCQALNTAPPVVAANQYPAANQAPPAAGGCGCNKGNTCGLTPPSAPSPQCGQTPQQGQQIPPTPIPNSTTPGGPIPPNYDIGRWNCQTTTLDLAPCDIERIKREDKLITFAGEEAGGIAAGEEIAVLFAPVDVSHLLCIELLEVEIVTEGVATAQTIGQFTLQGERIWVGPDGNYVHAWDWADPERPTYVNITDSRCECKNLCVCVPAMGHARLVFELPNLVPAGSTLRVRAWGRRRDWMTACGPCPPCDICDRVELTAVELAAVNDDLYVIP